MSDEIEASIGRVTGRIAPGKIGEVRIAYQGGSRDVPRVRLG